MSCGWHNVSRREPCPVCRKPDWCTISDDGMMCVCRRVESPHPAKSGMGWIHVLVERPRREWPPPRPSRPKPHLFDAAAAMRGFRAEFMSPGGGRCVADSLLEIALDLRLGPESVDRLRVGRSAFHGAWAFPMRDGGGAVVGIRLREYGTGRKWSVAGSRDGLFYDPSLAPDESVANGVAGRELTVVEGATDCIAGYELGLACVGRSSCGTGADALKALCARLRVGRVTIVCDNDRYRFRPDGTPWRPGADGAKALARSLGRTYRIVTPPKKDLREWLSAGLTAETFRTVADLQPWRAR